MKDSRNMWSALNDNGLNGLHKYSREDEETREALQDILKKNIETEALMFQNGVMRCPRLTCKAILGRGMRYCPHCGQRVNTEKPLRWPT